MNRFIILLVITLVIGGLMTTVVNAAELTEAEKKVLEAQLKAAELVKEGGQINPPATTETKIANAKLGGRVSNLTNNTLTVGIIGDYTLSVTGYTSVTFNGKTARLSALHIGDKVTVKYNPATKEALSIEAEGWTFTAVYTASNVPVIYVGFLGVWIGHQPGGLDYGFITNSAGVKLDAGVTQVTVNGAPATINDIVAGDVVSYVQSSVDLKAYFVQVIR